MPFTWDGNPKQPLSQRFVTVERATLPPRNGGRDERRPGPEDGGRSRARHDGVSVQEPVLAMDVGQRRVRGTATDREANERGRDLSRLPRILSDEPDDGSSRVADSRLADAILGRARRDGCGCPPQTERCAHVNSLLVRLSDQELMPVGHDPARSDCLYRYHV